MNIEQKGGRSVIPDRGQFASASREVVASGSEGEAVGVLHISGDSLFAKVLGGLGVAFVGFGPAGGLNPDAIRRTELLEEAEKAAHRAPVPASVLEGIEETERLDRLASLGWWPAVEQTWLGEGSGGAQPREREEKTNARSEVQAKLEPSPLPPSSEILRFYPGSIFDQVDRNQSWGVKWAGNNDTKIGEMADFVVREWDNPEVADRQLANLYIFDREKAISLLKNFPFADSWTPQGLYVMRILDRSYGAEDYIEDVFVKGVNSRGETAYFRATALRGLPSWERIPAGGRINVWYPSNGQWENHQDTGGIGREPTTFPEQKGKGEVVLPAEANLQELHADCECAATQTFVNVLKLSGKANVSLADGYDDVESQCVGETPSNPNPHEGYRGNAQPFMNGPICTTHEGCSYGSHAPMSAKFLREEYGIPATAVFGANGDFLEAAIRKGGAVIVYISSWGGKNITEADPETGEIFTVVPGEHAVVLRGVKWSGSSRYFLMDDPYPGNGTYWITEGWMEALRWGDLDNQCVIYDPQEIPVTVVALRGERPPKITID